MSWNSGPMSAGAGAQYVVSDAYPVAVRIDDGEIQADVRELLLLASAEVGYSGTSDSER